MACCIDESYVVAAILQLPEHSVYSASLLLKVVGPHPSEQISRTFYTALYDYLFLPR
jgi:hypothetical protein